MSRKTLVKHKPLKPRVWGIGLVALDLIIDSHSPGPRSAAGGTCGNVMTILSQLGWEANPVARLAKDVAAELVISDLQRWNVNTRLLHMRPLAKTPVIVEKIEKDSAGIPFHTFSFSCPGCGRRWPRFQPVTSASVSRLDSKLAGLDVLFIDRVSRGALALAEAAVRRGSVIFFEPSAASNPKHFSELLKITHVIKYSHDRIEDTAEIDWGPNMVLEIQTLGRGGLRFRTNLAKNHRVWRRLPAVAIPELRDAAGAGDWLSAALIHSLCPGGAKQLRKRSFERLLHALNFGQRLASWNCGFSGPRGSMYRVPLKEFRKVLRQLQLGRGVELVSESSASAELLKMAGAICEACKPADKKNSSNGLSAPRLSTGLR
jgi:sugar/nucleoside kinase (ribokinase family)